MADKNTSSPQDSAATQAFKTTEILGNIIGHLDPEDFCRIQRAHPDFLDTAKYFQELRRKFFLERDPTALGDEIKVNPVFKMMLKIAGWRTANVSQNEDWDRERGYEMLMHKDNRLSPPTHDDVQLLGSLVPLLGEMLLAQAEHPIDIWPAYDLSNGYCPRLFKTIRLPKTTISVLETMKVLLKIDAKMRKDKWVAPINGRRERILVSKDYNIAGLGTASWYFENR